MRGSARNSCEPDVLLSDRRTLSQDTLADLDTDMVSAENQKLSRDADDNDDSLATSIRLARPLDPDHPKPAIKGFIFATVK